MPLEPAETRSRSNCRESRVSSSKVRSAKLNTDVTISMPGTDYFGEIKPHLNNTSHTCQHHAEITQSRHTFAALIRLSTTTHNLLTFKQAKYHRITLKNSVCWQINSSGHFSHIRLMQVPGCTVTRLAGNTLRGEKLNYNSCKSLLLRKSQNLFFCVSWSPVGIKVYRVCSIHVSFKCCESRPYLVCHVTTIENV